MGKIKRPNAQAVPFDLFDKVMPEIKSLSELKVVFFIARNTIGRSDAKADGDWLSHGQMEKGQFAKSDGRMIHGGLGLSKPAILCGITKALKDGWIIQKRLCRSCDGKVALNEHKSVKRIIGYGPRKGEVITYDVPMVPERCPHCGAPLRGREKLVYSLNWDDEEESEG